MYCGSERSTQKASSVGFQDLTFIRQIWRPDHPAHLKASTTLFRVKGRICLCSIMLHLPEQPGVFWRRVRTANAGQEAVESVEPRGHAGEEQKCHGGAGGIEIERMRRWRRRKVKWVCFFEQQISRGGRRRGLDEVPGQRRRREIQYCDPFPRWDERIKRASLLNQIQGT